MVFSSTVFLFLFLPFVLVVNYLLQAKLRNVFILICSLFFYAWGENVLVLLMMGSICINYFVGILLSATQKSRIKYLELSTLFAGIILNLSVLIYYKYIGFVIRNLNNLGLEIDENLGNVTLPIGVSFFTFQNISYLIDIYRREVQCQKNILHLGLYISLFPQLIAGPIVRYVDIFKEITNRIITKELFAHGLTRFIRGLAKKVLIANCAGLIADKTFAISPEDISSSLAWIAILCYTLQIYFDFSGYSDMAIGLGKMLGFNFKENFNYPYIATSVQEFWRRWHISLSTWFRDYLYFPLGGNRKGRYRTLVNLITVFFITGLWHGASWSFVIWGLYHGAFLLLERVNPFTIPAKFGIIKRIYLLLVVVVGWVFFRVDDFYESLLFINKMFSFSDGIETSPFMYIDIYTIFILGSGILFSTPVRKVLAGKITERIGNDTTLHFMRYGFHLMLFGFTVMELAQTTYNPFIYFRF